MSQDGDLHTALNNLKNRNVHIRELSADALEEMLKKPKNVEELRGTVTKEKLVSWVKLSRDEGSVKVRRGIVLLLGKLGYKKLTNLLIVILKKDKDPGVREAAAVALDDVGGPQAEAALVKASKTDRSELVRKAAQNSLLGLEIQQHLPLERKGFGRPKSSEHKRITRRLPKV